MERTADRRNETYILPQKCKPVSLSVTTETLLETIRNSINAFQSNFPRFVQPVFSQNAEPSLNATSLRIDSLPSKHLPNI